MREEPASEHNEDIRQISICRYVVKWARGIRLWWNSEIYVGDQRNFDTGSTFMFGKGGSCARNVYGRLRFSGEF